MSHAMPQVQKGGGEILLLIYTVYNTHHTNINFANSQSPVLTLCISTKPSPWVGINIIIRGVMHDTESMWVLWYDDVPRSSILFVGKPKGPDGREWARKKKAGE